MKIILMYFVLVIFYISAFALQEFVFKISTDTGLMLYGIVIGSAGVSAANWDLNYENIRT